MNNKPERAQYMREIAYGWRSGQTSPLYAFATTGVVEDRRVLIIEIDTCIQWVWADAWENGLTNARATDLFNLVGLKLHIQHFPTLPEDTK